MYKYEYNHLILNLLYKADGPILIKSGSVGIDPSLPDMQFIRTQDPIQGEVPFLPGSSIRGVVRSFVERVLRSYSNINGACDIVDKKKNCLKQEDLRPPTTTELLYKKSCLACRTFGNQGIRSRIEFTDAYLEPQSKYSIEVRNGIAISRQLGSASHGGLYDLEVLTNGSFNGEIHLRNFELWQLGALALALQNFNADLLKIGFGANRGFGKLKVSLISGVIIEQNINPENEEKKITSIKYSFLKDRMTNYDLKDKDNTINLPETVKIDNSDLGIQIKLTDLEWQQLTPLLIQSLQKVVQ